MFQVPHEDQVNIATGLFHCATEPCHLQQSSLSVYCNQARGALNEVVQRTRAGLGGRKFGEWTRP